MTIDRIQGCWLGLALGDALGAPHEGGLVERLLWRLIGTSSDGRCQWTDDTTMSLDVAESLIANGRVDTDDLAARFARSYRWSRGYGPAAGKLLKRIRRGGDWRQANRSVYPEGSFGNGGAMRAPIVGAFYAARLDELPDAARASAGVTHAHPLGLEGAVLIAMATALAIEGRDWPGICSGVDRACVLEPFTLRLAMATDWLTTRSERTPAEVRRHLGNGIAAADSCVTALYLALRFLSAEFLELHQVIVQVGGDVDTIAAMAGAIWGAANGAKRLPRPQLATLEQHERIESLGAELHARAIGPPVH